MCEFLFISLFALCRKLPVAPRCTHHDRRAGVVTCHMCKKTCQMSLSQTFVVMLETPVQSLLLLLHLTKPEVNPLPLHNPRTQYRLHTPMCAHILVLDGLDVEADVKSMPLLHLADASKIMFLDLVIVVILWLDSASILVLWKCYRYCEKNMLDLISPTWVAHAAPTPWGEVREELDGLVIYLSVQKWVWFILFYNFFKSSVQALKLVENLLLWRSFCRCDSSLPILFPPTLFFVVSAVVASLPQQFGNVNRGAQDQIIHRCGLFVCGCVSFSFCSALLTGESRKKQQKKT